MTDPVTASRIGSVSEARAALNLPEGATAEMTNLQVINAGSEMIVGGIADGADWAIQGFVRDVGSSATTLESVATPAFDTGSLIDSIAEVASAGVLLDGATDLSELAGSSDVIVDTTEPAADCALTE